MNGTTGRRTYWKASKAQAAYTAAAALLALLAVPVSAGPVLAVAQWAVVPRGLMMLVVSQQVATG